MLIPEIPCEAASNFIGTLIVQAECSRVANDPRPSRKQLQFSRHNELAQLQPESVIEQMRESWLLEID